jgi:hypothetical protein
MARTPLRPSRPARPAAVVIPAAPTVSVDKQTAAYKLFHHRFDCIIAQMHLYSTPYLQISGMVTTGDRDADRAMATAPVRTWMTPAAMAQFLSDAAPFRLVKPSDAAPIYQMLTEHLNDWKQYVSTTMNPVDVPTDDLIKFDALAGEIYNTARGFLGQAKPVSGFFLKMQRNQTRRGIRRIAKDAADQPEELRQTHESIVDKIKPAAIYSTEPAPNRWRRKSSGSLNNGD